MALATVGTALGTAPDGAGAAVVNSLQRGPVVTLAPGITQYHERFVTDDGFHQSAWITTVDLTRPGVRLGVVAAHNTVESVGETVLSMAQRTHAVAGINGDLFDFGGTGAPYGGEVVDGAVVRSPSRQAGQLALLSDHRAVIGPLTWHGVLTRLGTVRLAHPVTVNSVGTAGAGGITVLNQRLGQASLPSGCVLAGGTRRLGTYTVGSLRDRVRVLPQLPSSGFVLLGCGAGGRWLRSHAGAGSRFTVTGTVTSPADPRATVLGALQGARQVLRNGLRWNDTTTAWHTAGHNPETFVCVARNRTSVLFGTVDGRMWTSVGVTFAQLTALMLRHGCYDGLVLDGGGSTTTVGSGVRGGPLSIRNVPAWGGWPRAVANGLFAFYAPA
ncbi:phosphodiester glycosidase family protein [Jatrophihabitans sp.]|uniref:phosphodiester glycosidase family protein n=1 Tax=Jatrophihabitans sp. TaxID=1932789 RepID=UPI003F81796B